MFLGHADASFGQGTPAFDSVRAFALLKRQCDFGPRPVGGAAHERTRDFLAAQLRLYTNSVELQNFQYTYGGKIYHLSNIIAKFGNTKSPGVLLCAHWDTRPTSDEELNPNDRKKPIMGADDGASGVAVLIELARCFHLKPPQVPVTIVLFDGEDFGETVDDMLLGSRHFAGTLGNKPNFRYGILLDMIGDKELDIYRERNSQIAAPAVVDKIWKAAADLGYRTSFINSIKYSMDDDHIPLIRAGLPCVDLIDFDYPYWHTLKDTPDKCSPQSLKIVGDTLVRVVYEERN